MKSLVLAAGYATRLYPLTQNFPKPLLEVGEFTIIDRLIQKIDQVPEIKQHIVVTNETFSNHFNEWKSQSKYTKEIVILNDGTTSNDNRLGAVKDILFAIEQLCIDEDLLVLAGDNVVTFSLEDFIAFAQNKQSSCITCHTEESIEALRKTGVLETNNDFEVLSIQEKPENPPSNWAVPPFYYYHKKDLGFVKDAINDGCDFDAPGNLAVWLCKKTQMYAWPINGKRYDIGDIKAYEYVQEVFK